MTGSGRGGATARVGVLARSACRRSSIDDKDCRCASVDCSVHGELAQPDQHALLRRDAPVAHHVGRGMSAALRRHVGVRGRRRRLQVRPGPLLGLPRPHQALLHRAHLQRRPVPRRPQGLPTRPGR